jgi:hypothetical protein
MTPKMCSDWLGESSKSLCERGEAISQVLQKIASSSRKARLLAMTAYWNIFLTTTETTVLPFSDSIN